MAESSVREGAELALQKLEARLLDAQGRLVAGNDEERVKAAGELEFLKQQKAALEGRLAELDRLPSGVWGRTLQWLEEEAAMLEQRIEAWLARN